MFFCKIKLIVLIVLTFLGVTLPSLVFSQYFYKDIWNTSQLNRDSKKLKDENIKAILMKSFEDDGSISEGFFCERKFDKDFSVSTMMSKSYITGNSVTLTFYNDGAMVTRVIDSTASSVNRTDYAYDHKRLKTLNTWTHSSTANDGIKESHEYIYNSAGQLDRMIRKKMGVEFSTINFVLDKAGNVTEEYESVHGKLVKSFFYYYDERNRLTDVVHNSERAKRLLPDYLYEYDASGQPIQMISTEEMTSNYFIWKYLYNERNLKKTEKCFSKEKRLLGSIEFSYK